MSDSVREKHKAIYRTSSPARHLVVGRHHERGYITKITAAALNMNDRLKFQKESLFHFSAEQNHTQPRPQLTQTRRQARSRHYFGALASVPWHREARIGDDVMCREEKHSAHHNPAQPIAWRTRKQRGEASSEVSVAMAPRFWCWAS